MAYEKNVLFSVDTTRLELVVQNPSGSQWEVTIVGPLEGPGGETLMVNQKVNLGAFPGGGSSKSFTDHLTFALDAALVAAGFSAV